MIKGISQNHSPEGTPKGYAFYGKNIILNRKLDKIINEKGTKIVDAFLSAGINKIVGVIPFNNRLIIFYNALTYAQEEKVSNGTFNSTLLWRQTKINSTDLDWVIANGEARAPFSATTSRTSSIIWQPLNSLKIGTNLVVSGATRLFGVADNLFGTFVDVLGNPIGTRVGLVGRNQFIGKFSKSLLIPPGAAGFGFYTTSVGVFKPGAGGFSLSYGPATLDDISFIGAVNEPVLGDKIGIYDEETDTFLEKVSRTDFNFSELNPITGRAKLNSKLETVVAFTDGNTFPKYINLDTAAPDDSLDLYNLFFISRSPSIAGEVVENAGGLKAGAYFATVQYVDKNKAAGNFSAFSAPIYIVQHGLTVDFRDTQGTDSGEATSKAISIHLTNLDPKFNKVRVSLVSKIKGNTSAAIYKELTYTGSEVTTIITGNEITTPVTIEEVITQNQIFDKVGEIESLNDQLFLADLTLSDVTDFQKIANSIKLNWTSRPMVNAFLPHANVVGPGSNNANLFKKDGERKGFMHEEVYAFYVQFELSNGRFTNWFTIPGRALSPSHTAASTVANGVTLSGETPKAFQIEDTVEVDTFNPADILTQGVTGKMGVWENEDEVYPETFPDFAGQKVRHHKFPSTHWLKYYVYDQIPPSGPIQTQNAYLTSMWDLLGISTSVTVPPEFTDKIKGYRIGYARRDTSNMTVLGYDVAMHGGKGFLHFGEGTDSIVRPATGNFMHVFEMDNGNIKFGYVEPNINYLRIHSPDLFILRPPVDNIYLSNLIKYKITNLQKLDDGYITAGRVAYNSAGSGAPDVWTYVSNFRYNQHRQNIPFSERFKALSSSRYVPANTTIAAGTTTIDNRWGEEILHTKVEGDLGIDLAWGTDGLHVSKNAVNSPGLYEETILFAIKAMKSNVFLSYTDQVVVPLSTIVRNLTTDEQTVINDEGDAFIVTHSFVTMDRVPNEGDHLAVPVDSAGIRNIKAFLAESRFNLSQRYYTPGDYSTYFFPSSGPSRPDNELEYWTAKLSTNNPDVNKIQYSKDFNAVADFEPYGIYKHGQDYVTELPFAIARSQKASRATDLDDGWRIFKPNDIFYTVRDKGRITNLCAWGTDSLLIHHQYALFRTRDKAVLQSDIGAISLGSGEIFAIEPAEVAPTSYGYGGLQNKFGALLCEAGYAFIDSNTGEVFIFDGGSNLKPISKGLRTFFEEVFRNQFIPDNPFYEGGVILGFDKENYRLLLSLKALTSFTASFDLIKEEWACLHDYLPDFFVNTRKQLYSFKNSSIHAHNKGAVGEYYGIIYPSFVDIVVNDAPDQEKILSAITWFSDIVEENKQADPSLNIANKGITKKHETITHVTIWNDEMCTGKIEVKLQTNIADYEGKNTHKAAGGWRFNEIKDATIDPNLPVVGGIFDDYRPSSTNIDPTLAWFERAEFRGTYFIIRLEYSNLENKTVSLRDLKPELRLSND